MTPVTRLKPLLRRRKKEEKKEQNSLIELVSIVAVALLLALGIQAVLVKPFRIPSESMVPTLEVGQRVLVDRVTYRWGEPERGDVVVFTPPTGALQDACGVDHPSNTVCPKPTAERADTNYIKRIVGLPGDRLKVISGRVHINGKLQDEPFIQPSSDCSLCNFEGEVTVPEDHYFMMGDNRGHSDDSRAWGPVPKKWLIGQAFMNYWPPKAIGPL